MPQTVYEAVAAIKDGDTRDVARSANDESKRLSQLIAVMNARIGQLEADVQNHEARLRAGGL